MFGAEDGHNVEKARDGVNKMDGIKVTCYSGYRGEQTPVRFWLGPRCVLVREVLDQWLSPDHRYFKVMGDDAGLYILRHDSYGDTWSLVFFNSGASSD